MRLLRNSHEILYSSSVGRTINKRALLPMRYAKSYQPLSDNVAPPFAALVPTSTRNTSFSRHVDTPLDRGSNSTSDGCAFAKFFHHPNFMRCCSLSCSFLIVVRVEKAHGELKCWEAVRLQEDSRLLYRCFHRSSEQLRFVLASSLRYSTWSFSFAFFLTGGPGRSLHEFHPVARSAETTSFPHFVHETVGLLPSGVCSATSSGSSTVGCSTQPPRQKYSSSQSPHSYFIVTELRVQRVFGFESDWV